MASGFLHLGSAITAAVSGRFAATNTKHMNTAQLALSASTSKTFRIKGWMRWSLLGAAIWNIFGGVNALADPAMHFSQLYTGQLSLSDPLQLYFFRCVWINVIAWGLGYALAAFVRGPHTAILVAGGLGKLFYCAACFALFATGMGKGMLVFAGVVDLLLGGLFATMVIRQHGSKATA